MIVKNFLVYTKHFFIFFHVCSTKFYFTFTLKISFIVITLTRYQELRNCERKKREAEKLERKITQMVIKSSLPSSPIFLVRTFVHGLQRWWFIWELKVMRYNEKL